MKNDKTKKKLPKTYNIIHPFLLLIATLFMGIGYASINSITADITGIIAANTQDGIFITDVTYDSNQNANMEESKINKYHQKMLSTKTVLEKDSEAYVTYNVTVYNSTDDKYILTGINFDETFYTDDNNKYNSDISIELTKIGEVLSSRDSLTFQVTFKYNNDNPKQNILNSYINFLFKKVYSVTYTNIQNDNYPTTVIEKQDLIVDMSDTDFISFIIKIDNTETFDYTYENKILTIPNVTGNITIEGLTGKYLVNFDTNIEIGEYVETGGFTIEKQTESEGEYYRASFNKTTGQYDEWYYISFPAYDYNVGSTYRIRMKTRVQSATLDFIELRHAAINNDWGTEGREYIQFTDDPSDSWTEHTITRTFPSATTTQGGTTHNLSPRIEIYTSNLTLAGGINYRSLTFDYKDLYVGEYSTYEYDYGSKLGTLPTPTREGYIFKGWYTKPEGGTRITSQTLVTTNNVNYYAQWVSETETIYDVTYKNITNNDYPTFVVANETLVVDMSDTSFESLTIKMNNQETNSYTYENKILTIPNVTGDIIIEGISNKYLVILDSNIKIDNYSSTQGFTIEKQTESEGDYYRASFNKTTGTTDEWYYISFPTYNYKVGSTYRIRLKTRLQEKNLDFAEIRHASIENDWGTPGLESIQFTNDEIGVWKNQTLTRTFNSATTTQNGEQFNLSPRLEIYTTNLILSEWITSRSLTFDYKDIYIGELTTIEYNEGEEIGTLPTPTREGYIFKGWYTKPEGGTKVNSKTVVTDKKVYYYAQWVSESETIYNVTYENIDNNDYPTFVVANETLVVDMSDNSYDSLVVKINGINSPNYTYKNKVLTIPNVTGNVTIEGLKATPESLFLFDQETNTILGLTDDEYDQDVIIPSEINGVKVTAIADNAFNYYSNITRVIIPDGVTTIGNNAFRDCYNVKEFVIPNTVISIGDNAFRESTSITQLTIPDSVVTIGEWAFAGAANLETITIGRNVTSIGNSSLSYNPKLTTVYYRATNLQIPSDRWGARNQATFIVQ